MGLHCSLPTDHFDRSLLLVQTIGANCECNGRVWRMDVGMSKGVLNAKPQV